MSTCKIDKAGNKVWRNSKNQLHREDGPAIEYADGSKAWWLKGVCHREDGPAVEYADGSKAWYLNGRYYSFKNYCNKLLKRKLITENELVLFQIKYSS